MGAPAGIPLVARAGAVLLALLAAAPAHGAVLEVGGGGPFATVVDAVAAAADGDVILIAGGDYPGIVHVVDTTLVLVADAGAAVSIPGLRVRALDASRSVTVIGLAIGADGVELADGAGTVWLQDCSSTSGPALRADGCAAVVLQRCTLSAPDGSPAPAGLRASASNLFLYDTVVEAGDGAGASAVSDGQDGGRAVDLLGGTLLADACRFTAGDGGDALDPLVPPAVPCPDAGDGGDALVLAGGALARLRATTLEPGAGGAPSPRPGECLGGPGAAGMPGVPASIAGGTLVTLTSPSPTLVLDAPSVEGGTITGSLTALANDVVFFVMSVAPTGIYKNGLQGAQLTAAPFVVFAEPGPPGGASPIVVTAPPLPAGLPVLVLVAQIAASNPADGTRLGSASVVVLLDDAL